MTDTLLIDDEILEDMIEHLGGDSLRPVIDLFLDESRRLSGVIVAGVDSPAGRDTVRRAAHSLKSSAGQLGAAALSEAAAAVERAAENGTSLAEPAAAVARFAEATVAAFTERMKM